MGQGNLPHSLPNMGLSFLRFHSATSSRIVFRDEGLDGSFVQVAFFGTDLSMDPVTFELERGTIDQTTISSTAVEADGSRNTVVVYEGYGVPAINWDVLTSDLSILAAVLFSTIDLNFASAQDRFRDITPLVHTFVHETWYGRDDPEAVVAGPQLIEAHMGGGGDFLQLTAPEGWATGDDGDDLLILLDEGQGTLFGGAGDDTISGAAGGDVLYGQSGNDVLVSSSPGRDDARAPDTLYGGPGHDILLASNIFSANDTLHGGDGRDYLQPWGGLNLLIGGADTDVFAFDLRYADIGETRAATNIVKDFTLGEDVISIGFNDKTMFSPWVAYDFFIHFAQQVGDDTVFDNGVTRIILRNITIEDLSEAEFFPVREGQLLTWPDVPESWIVEGSAGDDLVQGLFFFTAEKIFGRAGNDTIQGRDGSDSLFGNAGDDYILGDGERDASGYIFPDRFAGDDTLFGGRGNDELRGEGGNDLLYGQAGDDILRGGYGNDSLYGGTGRDLLMAYHGETTLTGGADADAFVFFPASRDFYQAPPDDLTSRVVITDFDPTEDFLFIRESDNGFEEGIDRHTQFHAGATQQGDHVVFDSYLTRVVILNTTLEDFTPDRFIGDAGGFYSWTLFV